MTERLLTPQEVAEYLGVPVSTLYAWRYRGEGPRSGRVGRHVRYRAEDLKAYEEQAFAADRRQAGRSPPPDPVNQKARSRRASRAAPERLPERRTPRK